MNENTRMCPMCGHEEHLKREEVMQLVTSNREAAMQALGIHKDPRELRPRFRLQPFVDESGDVPRIGVRRAAP